MGELITKRTYDIKADDNGLVSVPVDVSSPDGSVLNRRSFSLATGGAGCTMKADDLEAMGYDTSAPVVLPLIRIGAYDFVKLAITVGSANVLGANVLKWLDYSISNSEGIFAADLVPRLKGIVEKGINPNIKLAFMSSVKASEYNENENWLTWAEIDNQHPNSWILVRQTDEVEYGGEILWFSETSPPDTTQSDMFLYCNKSVATQKPFMVQLADNFHCRSFAAADRGFAGYIEELEAKLTPPPTIDRFYYDPVSRQGKLFIMKKSADSKSGDNSGAVLTQAAIDALLAELLN